MKLYRQRLSRLKMRKLVASKALERMFTPDVIIREAMSILNQSMVLWQRKA